MVTVFGHTIHYSCNFSLHFGLDVDYSVAYDPITYTRFKFSNGIGNIVWDGYSIMQVQYVAQSARISFQTSLRFL